MLCQHSAKGKASTSMHNQTKSQRCSRKIKSSGVPPTRAANPDLDSSSYYLYIVALMSLESFSFARGEMPKSQLKEAGQHNGFISNAQISAYRSPIALPKFFLRPGSLLK